MSIGKFSRKDVDCWKCGEKEFLLTLANYVNVIDVCNQSPAE